MPPTARKTSIQVWDPLVRYGHWALVVAFAIAWLSAEDESDGPERIHVWAGYAVGIIVAVRIIWGLVGTRHARFGDFTYGPVTALRYLADMVRGRGRRYVGHSPAATYMIAALLLSLSATVGTGLVAYGDLGKGPLAGGLVTTVARAEELRERPEREAGFVGELHGVLANITLGLVGLHVLGVVLASVVHRENLVAAMFNGRKRSGDEG